MWEGACIGNCLREARVPRIRSSPSCRITSFTVRIPTLSIETQLSRRLYCCHWGPWGPKPGAEKASSAEIHNTFADPDLFPTRQPRASLSSCVPFPTVLHLWLRGVTDSHFCSAHWFNYPNKRKKWILTRAFFLLGHKAQCDCPWSGVCPWSNQL